MRKLHPRVFLATLIICLFLRADVAFGTDLSDHYWAQNRLREFMRNPMLISPGLECAAFQCEYDRLDLHGNAQTRQWRFVFEEDIYAGDPSTSGSGMLMLSEKGFPFLFANRYGVIASIPRSSLNEVIPKLGYWIMIKANEGLRELYFHESRQFAAINMEKLLCDIQAPGLVCITAADPLARTATISNGLSPVELRFTRERRMGQFPLVSMLFGPRYNLIVPSDDDKRISVRHHGTEDPSILLTNFYVFRNRIPEGGVPRRISNLQGKEDPMLFVPAAEGTSAERLTKQLKWMSDWERSEKIINDKRFQKAGMAILDRLPAKDRFSAGEAARVRADLKSMRACIEKPEVPAAGDACRAALDDLAAFLGERVVDPVRIERWSFVPCYVAGHERWKTANMLEARAGPALTAAIYNGIRQLVIGSKVPLPIRIQTLDLLGEIGVHNASKMLVEIEGELQGASQGSPPKELMAMLSSVKVRAGIPGKKDIERLKAAVADTAAPLELRAPCLEALLLVDEAAGRELFIRDLVTRPSRGKLDFPTRCLFAAGLSEDGRNVLLNLAAAGSASDLFVPALSLLETSVLPGDSQWEGCQRLAERLALDANADWRVRLKASQIAARSEEHRAFRDKYVRAAVRSGNLTLINALEEEYLKPETVGHAYAADFQVAMCSPDRAVRDAAAQLFCRSCGQKWRPEHEAGVCAVMDLLIVEGGKDSLGRALWLLGKMKQADSPAIKEYVGRFVALARKQTDPDTFYMIFNRVADACGLPRDKSFNPFYDKESHRRPPEETRRLIEERRGELQTQADAWLKESRR